MRAAQIERFGDARELTIVDLDRPHAGPGEVVVRIQATSVNPVDYKIRSKGPGIAPELPAVLGCDLAGTVTAVGAAVTAFKPGDEVYGCAGGVRGMPGTYSEYIATDARLLARKPDGLSMREAAALPLVSITAWEALVERAGVRPGQTVLIHGGAGGVGHVALQIARSLGAMVHTTVSSDGKASIARDLGADETINYREESVQAYVDRLTAGRGFDVVFDATGGSDLPLSFEAAAINGTVLTIVSQYQTDLTLMHLKNLSLHVIFMLIPMLHNIGRERHGVILDRLAALVRRGQVRPLLDQREFELADIAEAHRHAESGQAVGKVTLAVEHGG